MNFVHSQWARPSLGNYLMTHIDIHRAQDRGVMGSMYVCASSPLVHIITDNKK